MLRRRAAVDPDRGDEVDRTTLLFVAVVAVVGVVVRAWPRGPMWLDEAQSTAFARLSPGELWIHLREDGAPPLYSLLLHGWIAVVGDGDGAVRSLSLVCSLAAGAVLTWFARRESGRRTAVVVAVLVASSPFAVRYASEARMYSLVMLEVSLGAVALARLLRRGSIGAAAALAAIAAALLYTHYWSIYLLGGTGVVLLALAVSRRGRAAVHGARLGLVALVVGGVAWLPWLPAFRHQAAHTATPWATTGIVVDPLLAATRGAPSGGRPAVVTLAVVLAVGLVSALVVASRTRRDVIATHAAAVVRVVLVVLVVATALATVGTAISDSAVSPRYTSVLWPLLVLAAGVGLAALPTAGRLVLTVLAAVAGLVLAVHEIDTPRTTASAARAALAAHALPGDEVVVCPDQLGPALVRLLDQEGPAGLDVTVFPPGRPPDRVDWTDYTARHAGSVGATSERVAADLDRRAGDRPLFVVWSATYPPTQGACGALVQALLARRPGEVLLLDDARVADHGAVWMLEPDGD